MDGHFGRSLRPAAWLRPFAALALIFAMATPASAAAAQEAPGRIDWTAPAVVGEAPLRGPFRACLLAARKNLWAALTRVRIAADLDAAGRMAADRRLAERLRVLAMTAPAQTVPEAGGGDALRVVLPLSGEALALLLPPAANARLAPRLPDAAAVARTSADLARLQRRFVTLRPQSGAAGGRPAAQTEAAASAAAEASPEVDSGHTGLVVDARGLNVVPALSPVLYDADGVGIYGAFAVSRESVVRSGLVVYARNIDGAALRERVGPNPLVVKAAGPVRESGPDLRLAAPEARAVRALMRAGNLTARCAVAILTDD